ncbi:uncharacterized protein LOC120631559 [Pararge aegeria]|uniref:Jg15335 protein n=1 Tax=Pararge aegeria aegeria TaxID=348720 RepID=A0A8S4RGY9_9NEOP|nr:uncharacterized protein LOC120631559 [Pararge aegeria]XP_039757127.1 uncharacterized protein LOC120631559 [Pararge aegeria]CAH2236576.1 jg15335 [Pararge aegeria aegeria]
MHLEIPECKRCCFCVPLRHGVLIFGYLHFAFTIFIVAVEIWVFSTGEVTYHTITLFRGAHMYIHYLVAVGLHVAEIIFNIVLLVGAHMKKPQLLRAYYYYGITTTVASFVTFVVLWLRLTCRHCYFMDYLIEVAFLVTGIGIQIYLLLLIRSELLKIRKNNHLCYVNHASEMVVDAPLQSGHNPF